MAAEPRDNPRWPSDDEGRANSNAGLARDSAPNWAPVSGSDTCRLFPFLGSAPRLGRRRLPVVRTAQLPADANGIEIDFRGNLDGVPSGEGVESSTVTVWLMDWGSGRGSCSIWAAGSNLRGVAEVDTIFGLTRCALSYWSSSLTQMRLEAAPPRVCGPMSPKRLELVRPLTLDLRKWKKEAHRLLLRLVLAGVSVRVGAGNSWGLG